MPGARSTGVRMGNWLTLPQAQQLASKPSTRQRRKACAAASCWRCSWAAGLRRGELAGLGFDAIAQREGRWAIVDLVGKHGRVRTVPMPSWAKAALDGWAAVRRHRLRIRAAPRLEGRPRRARSAGGAVDLRDGRRLR